MPEKIGHNFSKRENHFMQRIGKLITLLLISTVTCLHAQEVSNTCELIKNGNFDSFGSEWSLGNYGGGGWKEIVVDDDGNKYYQVAITFEGLQSWALQVTQGGFKLNKGKKYRLSFDAWTDRDRKIHVKVGKNGTPYNAYIQTDTLQITTTPTAYTLNFDMIVDDPNARVEFNLGLDTADVFLDNISLIEFDCSKEDQRKSVKAIIEDIQGKPGFTSVAFSGYVRAFLIHRALQEKYPDEPYAKSEFLINGNYPDSDLSNGITTGYREPLLMLELKAKPTGNTYVNVDFVLDNQLLGTLQDTSRRIQTYRYLNFEGGIATDAGSFKILAGGVLFTKMSPFTMWNYIYRDDMFERYPWESSFDSYNRYNNFYERDDIVRDSRFGNAQFQGIALEASDLPYGLGAKVVYGKTNNSSGFQSFLNNNYQYILGGRLTKGIGFQKIGFNYLGQRAYIDNVSDEAQAFDIITTDLSLNFPGVAIFTEVGTGTVTDPIETEREWDVDKSLALNVKADFSPTVTGVPITVQGYYLGEGVVNLNNMVLNSSNQRVQAQFGNEQQYNVNFLGGVLGEVGQLVNNRKGLNISAKKEFGPLHLGLGLGISEENSNLYDQVTVYHRLNSINRSRFIFYRNQLGPYDRIMNNWRRSWETFAVTDTMRTYKKGFSQVELSIKHKMYLFGKPLILSDFTNYNSVQDGVSIIPKFDDNAFIRYFYNELMAFYALTDRFTLVGFGGVERVWGNDLTELSPDNGEPINQTGWGVGLGFDYDIGDKIGFYFRERYYIHEDKNFSLDKFQGIETSVELKIFF